MLPSFYTFTFVSSHEKFTRFFGANVVPVLLDNVCCLWHEVERHTLHFARCRAIAADVDKVAVLIVEAVPARTVHREISGNFKLPLCREQDGRFAFEVDSRLFAVLEIRDHVAGMERNVFSHVLRHFGCSRRHGFVACGEDCEREKCAEKSFHKMLKIW